MEGDEVTPEQVRMSVAALARVRTDDGLWFVLIGTPRGLAPLGGAIQYRRRSELLLRSLRFQPERGEPDLRGLLPAANLPEFRSWPATGVDRETADEALLREIAEELGEVGQEALAATLPKLEFAPAHVLVEEPAPVPDKPWWQFRHFEVYDLVAHSRQAVRFRDRLVALAADPAVPTVALATGAHIARGELGDHPIAPQSRYLLGSTPAVGSAHDWLHER
ncbi:hypothetical protein ALI22I_20215 [Saccharothrix sp. ALI-22-I]|uniref:SMODS-associated NUDIX domain-containing protein n=1 Tax=Saccharothrix sp. ALI-22-I TaxID=1933778 RepID=UPI0009C6AD18|nr:hypothetical protein [Saccharothrix sp. ALI-22-I]ONI88067.1 hypothetical protein ALI22I_20215 [Saccharothrix sp. ALI-22-I]